MSLPFIQIQKGPDNIRTFSSKIDDSELKWHWDEQDRTVTPINENDWQFQFDDQLPMPLTCGQAIFIPEGLFHRVIKGTTDLVVKIQFH
jgi:hypothetical protein